MDCSIIEEYEDEEFEFRLSQQANKKKVNGLGFMGGPIWHYPEEEIEFFPSDEVDNDLLEEDSDIESCSGSSIDNFRLQMIENYIETHDILDDDFDLFYGHNRNVDYALSQPPPSVIIELDSERRECDSVLDDDHISTSNYKIIPCCKNENTKASNSSLPNIISPLSLTKKSSSWIQPKAKRRRRTDKVSINNETTIIKEPRFDRFREATMCVPFEYTTKLATFYIRRPYGLATAPELFRLFTPHMTDQEYEIKSQVSSPKTIQVAISISADQSTMLLYGSAGVRYKKTNSSGDRSDKWIDVADVGLMDVPLGYVNYESSNITGNRNIEYSLDEILEEAMFVREQYCSTIVSAALEAEHRQFSGQTKAPSPPSLAKSIVSTPPRSNYYYDGSSNDSKTEEQEEEIKGRKLDFMHCLSPSLMTKGSIGSGSCNNPLKQRKKRRRRQVFRFLQRMVIVIGFYICGIFLVGNLSGVDYNLPSTFIFEHLAPSYNNGFAMFRITTNDQKPTTTQLVPGEKKQTTNVAELEDHYASMRKVEDERDIYKRKLETTEELLRKQVGDNLDLSLKYDLERAKTEKLRKEEDDAVALVQNLLIETETLAADVDFERVQRQKLERTIRELENEIKTLSTEKAKVEAALRTQTSRHELEKTKPEHDNVEEFSEVILVDSMDATNAVGENRSLEGSIYETHQEHRQGDSISHNKVDIFARYLKSSITKHVEKVVRLNHGIHDKRSEMDLVRDTRNNPFLAQHTLKFTDDNKKIREMFKSSKERVLKQTKDSSDSLRRNVKKNVDDVLTSGIKKMDHGQEAIKVVGDFAKTKLQTVGERARIFVSKKWRKVRSRK